MDELEPMRDHWWWRPGWRVGRSFFTWHVTFVGQPGACRLVAGYAPVLAELPVLDPVPIEWLHLTLQGVGFTDEVDRGDVDRIVAAARERCAGLKPFTITIGPAHVEPETIRAPARPLEPLAGLRRAIRAAIGDVWGPQNVPEPADGFRARLPRVLERRRIRRTGGRVLAHAHRAHGGGDRHLRVADRPQPGPRGL